MIDSGRQSLSDGQYGHKRREIRKEISTLSIFFLEGDTMLILSAMCMFVLVLVSVCKFFIKFS